MFAALSMGDLVLVGLGFVAVVISLVLCRQ